MKYITFQVSKHLAIPVIFPATLVHDDVAQALLPLLKRQFLKAKVRSAGEVSSLDLQMTSGRSDTLDIDSNPDDGPLLWMYDYNHGYVEAPDGEA